MTLLSQETGDISEFEEYQMLLRSLRWTEGFGIFFVSCLPNQGERIIRGLREDMSQKRFGFLSFTKETKTLYDKVEDLTQREEIEILCITGLEKSLNPYIKEGYGGQGDYYREDTVPPILGHLNWQRERFRDDFNTCLVFFLPKFAIKYFIRRAPDFYDWRSGVFEFPPDKKLLQKSLQELEKQLGWENIEGLTFEECRSRILEIEALLDEDSDQVVLLYKQALLLFRVGQSEEAIARVDRGIALESDNSFPWILRGYFLYSLGNLEAALDSLDKAIALKPEDHQALILRENMLNNLRMYSEELDSLDKAIALNPKDHQAWFIKGVRLNDLGMYTEALNSYNKAIALKPDYHFAWYNKGVPLKNLGRYTEALDSLDKAIALQPNFMEVWYHKGVLLNDLGRYTEALNSLDKAIALKPDCHFAWYSKGVTLKNLGRYTEALDSLDKAIALRPNFMEAWYNRGILLKNLGRYTEALDSLDKAIALKPDDYKA